MKNNKGFTLIELLAVITIMGILMMVAIPTISRTIENARKDTFLDVAAQYTRSVQNMWSSDNLQCGDYSSSAVATGTYYVQIDSSNPSLNYVLEQGGKSPWGQRDIKGIIVVAVYFSGETRDISFYPVLVDGIHGINVKRDGSDLDVRKSSRTLDRSDITMSGADYSLIVAPSGNYKTWSITIDLNNDGDKDDFIDGVSETSGVSTICVAR